MYMKLDVDNGKIVANITNYQAGRTVINEGDDNDVTLLIVNLADTKNIDDCFKYAGTPVEHIKISRINADETETVLYESEYWSVITNVNAFAIPGQFDDPEAVAQMTFQ